MEEGQREQWFQSELIVTLSIMSALGILLLGFAQMRAAKPIIKLRLLRNRTYASVIVIIVSVGMVLYDILYVLPQFLGVVAGYNAEQAGWVLALSGLPAFMMMPLLPKMLAKGDTRILVACGLVCFAASCFLDIHLTAQSGGGDFIFFAAAARCGTDLVLHAVESNLGGFCQSRRHGRCGRILQHGPQFRRLDRSGIAGCVHRPPH